MRHFTFSSSSITKSASTLFLASWASTHDGRGAEKRNETQQEQPQKKWTFGRKKERQNSVSKKVMGKTFPFEMGVCAWRFFKSLNIPSHVNPPEHNFHSDGSPFGRLKTFKVNLNKTSLRIVLVTWSTSAKVCLAPFSVPRRDCEWCRGGEREENRQMKWKVYKTCSSTVDVKTSDPRTHPSNKSLSSRKKNLKALRSRLSW